MKKQSLQILHRYRTYLLEMEQITLQEKIVEENQQKQRLAHLQARIQTTHQAKAQANHVEDLCSLDEAAAYLHGRVTLARRAITLSGQAREEALDRTLASKKARDQIGLLLEKERLERARARDEAERSLLDELATSRYAMTKENS